MCGQSSGEWRVRSQTPQDEGLQSRTLSGSGQPGSPGRCHRRGLQLQLFADGRAPGPTLTQQAAGRDKNRGHARAARLLQEGEPQPGAGWRKGACREMALPPQWSQLEHKVPPGKGASAAVLSPCAKVNNFKCKTLSWPVAVIIVNILAAPRTFQRGHTVLTQERR